MDFASDAKKRNIYNSNANIRHRHDLMSDCGWSHYFPAHHFLGHYFPGHYFPGHRFLDRNYWAAVDTVGIDCFCFVVGNAFVDLDVGTIGCLDYHSFDGDWNYSDSFLLLVCSADNYRCCSLDSIFVNCVHRHLFEEEKKMKESGSFRKVDTNNDSCLICEKIHWRNCRSFFFVKNALQIACHSVSLPQWIPFLCRFKLPLFLSLTVCNLLGIHSLLKLKFMLSFAEIVPDYLKIAEDMTIWKEWKILW